MQLSGRKLSKYITPMLATAVDEVFDSDEWLFELKLDGYRAIAEISNGKVLLYSRNGLDLTTHYPVVTAALKKIKKKMIVDGEIVWLNEKGLPDFQRLQNRKTADAQAIVYYVFDILQYQDKDVKGLPLTERKALLQRVLPVSAAIRYSDHVTGEGKKLFRLVKSKKMEGIMAKRADSIYMPGVRTREWLKIKHHHSQEAIIIGYTEPRGARTHFGSLLLAQYKKDKLHYIGHAGTGFNEKALAAIMKTMQPFVTAKKPVPDSIKPNGKVTWLLPKLVCEIEYSEITREGIMRHPVFKGLRPDKKSKQVHAETEKEVALKKVLPAKRKKATIK